jgi:hypothetical protein
MPPEERSEKGLVVALIKLGASKCSYLRCYDLSMIKCCKGIDQSTSVFPSNSIPVGGRAHERHCLLSPTRAHMVLVDNST